MRRNERLVTIWSAVLDEGPGYVGAAGDGTRVYHWNDRRDAERSIIGRTLWGQPARLSSEEVPVRLARRWGLA